MSRAKKPARPLPVLLVGLSREQLVHLVHYLCAQYSPVGNATVQEWRYDVGLDKRKERRGTQSS